MTKQYIELANTSSITHEDWLKIRRLGIGGSDAATVLGFNPYMSRFELYLDKLGQLPEKEETEAMILGKELEGFVARRWAEKTGKKVRRCNQVLQSTKWPWMIANIDRDVVGENAGLECKTTSLRNPTRFDKGDIPGCYYCQCVHYMAVTGAQKWYLAVAVLNSGFFVYDVPRDESDIEVLVEAEKVFWQEHVLGGKLPEPDGSDGCKDAIKALYPQAAELLTCNLFGLEDKAAQYMELKGQAKELEKAISKLAQEIQLEMGDAEIGYMEQGYEAQWKNQKQERIDSKKLRAEFPEAAAACAKATCFRKFEIKEREVI